MCDSGAYAVRLWQRVRLGSAGTVVEEVRTKRDRCVPVVVDCVRFPEESAPRQKRVPLPSACVPARSLTRFW